MQSSIIGTLIEGLWITLAVTALGSVGATVASVIAGLARISLASWVRWAAALYVAVFRGTSALVQLFWVYFALPLIGVRVDAMSAGVIVLALNTGAYGAELVRGAIQAVPEGQWRAARAIGLSRSQSLRHVIGPQALPRFLPPYGNLLIELCKNSALVSLVTLSDLTFQANTVLRVQQPGRTAEIFAWTLLLYFGIAQLIRGVIWFAGRRTRAALGAGGAR
jgi:polar amino acid transport system permease protein